jgi:hypothetical protein
MLRSVGDVAVEKHMSVKAGIEIWASASDKLLLGARGNISCTTANTPSTVNAFTKGMAVITYSLFGHSDAINASHMHHSWRMWR